MDNEIRIKNSDEVGIVVRYKADYHQKPYNTSDPILMRYGHNKELYINSYEPEDIYNQKVFENKDDAKNMLKKYNDLNIINTYIKEMYFNLVKKNSKPYKYYNNGNPIGFVINCHHLGFTYPPGLALFIDNDNHIKKDINYRTPNIKIFASEEDAMKVYESEAFNIELKTEIDKLWNEYKPYLDLSKGCDYKWFTVNTLLEYCKQLKEAGKGNYKICQINVPSRFADEEDILLESYDRDKSNTSNVWVDEEKKTLVFLQREY